MKLQVLRADRRRVAEEEEEERFLTPRQLQSLVWVSDLTPLKPAARDFGAKYDFVAKLIH